MYNRTHIALLSGATLFILVLIYAIVHYQIQQFQTDNFRAMIEQQNEEITLRIAEKETLEKYISTNAYRTQIAKATQNKLMPGEILINVVSQDDIDSNPDIDAQQVIHNINETITRDPTENMTNPERWRYLFEKWIR